MHVSAFMKALKQRFTQWYKSVHEHHGTFWSGRFRSVVVEGAGHILAGMAAYIDRNSQKAGVCADPAEDRWCGYAQALAGDKRALEGLNAEKLYVLRALRVRLFGESGKKPEKESSKPGPKPEDSG